MTSHHTNPLQPTADGPHVPGNFGTETGTGNTYDGGADHLANDHHQMAGRTEGTRTGATGGGGGGIMDKIFGSSKHADTTTGTHTGIAGTGMGHTTDQSTHGTGLGNTTGTHGGLAEKIVGDHPAARTGDSNVLGQVGTHGTTNTGAYNPTGTGTGAYGQTGSHLPGQTGTHIPGQTGTYGADHTGLTGTHGSGAPGYTGAQGTGYGNEHHIGGAGTHGNPIIGGTGPGYDNDQRMAGTGATSATGSGLMNKLMGKHDDRTTGHGGAAPLAGAGLAAAASGGHTGTHTGEQGYTGAQGTGYGNEHHIGGAGTHGNPIPGTHGNPVTGTHGELIGAPAGVVHNTGTGYGNEQHLAGTGTHSTGGGLMSKLTGKHDDRATGHTGAATGAGALAGATMAGTAAHHGDRTDHTGAHLPGQTGTHPPGQAGTYGNDQAGLTGTHGAGLAGTNTHGNTVLHIEAPDLKTIHVSGHGAAYTLRTTFEHHNELVTIHRGEVPAAGANVPTYKQATDVTAPVVAQLEKHSIRSDKLSLQGAPQIKLKNWLGGHGTRKHTFEDNGVTYEWRKTFSERTHKLELFAVNEPNTCIAWAEKNPEQTGLSTAAHEPGLPPLPAKNPKSTLTLMGLATQMMDLVVVSLLLVDQETGMEAPLH